jgi:transposase
MRSARLLSGWGISTKSIYTWKALFSKPVTVRNSEADLTAEVRRVKKELVRVTEERDILKKAATYFARESR